MFPRFRTLENAVLLKLYQIISEEGYDGWDGDRITKELFKSKVAKSYANKLFQHVVGSGHVARAEDESGEPYFTLTGSGMKHVEEMLDNDSSEIFRLAVDGLDSLFGGDQSPSNSDAGTGLVSPEVEINKESYTWFKDALLVALAIKEENEGPAYRELKDVAKEFELKYKPGWVRKAGGAFNSMGFIEAAFTLGGGEDGGMQATLTGAGLEAAEELRRSGNFDFPSKGISSGAPLEVPASDRIVTLDDNDPKVIKVREALSHVAEEVRANNAYAESEPSDWAQRRAESEASKQLFSAPRISVEAIKAGTLRSLEYLAKKFVDHAIGFAAASAIAAILALIG